MLPGDRFKGWIDGLSEAWKDRLGGWMASWFSWGANAFLESAEPTVKEAMRDTLTRIKDYPNTPPEIKKGIDVALEKGDWQTTLSGFIWYHLGILPSILQSGTSFANLVGYDVEMGVRTSRLDPISVITAWRRDPATYEKYFHDLKEQGWSDERIEALKYLTEVYPTPRDIVGFLAHEVFEPDMVDKYSLLSEWGAIEKEFAKKIGVEEDILKLYWMDHWKHPEWGTIQELRHRDQITDQDVKDWFRLVEIPEYWRPKMLEVLWGLPNRIEIRMMARYLDMSKEEIEDLLKKAGLHEDFRSDAADFMMIMGLTGYWSDMLSKGWMSPAEVKADIDARGFKPITAERLYKRLVSADKPERTAAEKDLTKTEIYKGVKKKLLSWGEGVELLMDLGYDEDEADYILAVNVGVLEGSPETFAEFKDWTNKYRIATGREAKPMPEELKAAAAEVVRVTNEIEALNRSIEEEKRGLIEEEVVPEAATKRLKKLQVSLHRAEAELTRVQSDYDKRLTEWRHTAT